jgi:ABC-type transport system involved in multi-copper enzyme maturation permease subunit
MGELLRTNTLTHLVYFRRSRLLLAFGLVFLLLTLLGSLPAIFSNSKVASFDSLKQIFDTLNIFLVVFGAALGLLIMWSHLSNRSLKMVFTKPCPPALWLASTFLASALVSLLLSGVVLAGMLILSLVWHLPIRAGLVFISFDTFLAAVEMSAYFIFLDTFLHPAIAVAFALVFNASLFYWLRLWAHGAIATYGKSIMFRGMEHVFHFLYLLVPMTRPFESRTGAIYSSFRVHAHDWRYLLYSSGYTLTLSGLFFLLSLFFLQRKRFS